MTRTALLAIPALLAAAASSATAQSLMLTNGEVVQGVGDAVPGQPGVTVGGTSPFSTPVMDLNGTILWRAKLTGTGITTNVNDQALFYGRTASDVTLLLQRGDAEPTGTMPGVTVSYSSTSWDAARISPQGNYLLFASPLTGAVTTTDDSAIFWGPPGALQVLLREGGAAPASTGGATFTGNLGGAQNVTQINSSGLSVCKVKLAGGNVTGTSDDDAWLIGYPGAMDIMCREGDPLNGGAQAVGLLDGFRPTIDETGRVLFVQPLSTTLGTNPATAADDAAIMLYTPGPGLSIVVREGDPAPGSGGCVYGSFSSSSGFSNQGFSRTTGRVVFTNSMTGGDVTGSTNDTSVFAGTVGGTFARVAREAEAAPTGVSGEIYQALFPNGIAQINESGTVVFVAQLGPTGISTFQDVAVFLARPPYGPNDVQMILREGQAVAGLPTGWVIGNTSGGGMTSSGTTLLLNERDEVLINVAGVGDPTATNWGVPAQIAWDAEHGARLANLQGETFVIQASAQVQSAAAGVVATASGDGGNLSFNNNGDQCSRVFFTGTVPTAIMRWHVGSFAATPATFDVATGGTQAFQLDVGPSHGLSVYVILGTTSGTRPGFLSPLGPQTVPLNFDGWTQLSLDLANSPIYANSLWFTDPQGVAMAPASFTLPPGVSGAQGLLLHHAAVVLDFATLQSTFATDPTSLRLR